MAEKQIEITTLKLTLGKKEIELTIDEARRLHAALGELFEPKPDPKAVLEELKKIAGEKPIPMPYPVPMPIYPKPYYEYWKPTCTDTKYSLAGNTLELKS